MWSRSGGRLPGRRAQQLSLAGQLLLLQLVVLAVVLFLVGLLSVQQSTEDFEEERGSQLRSVAEYVGTLPLVRSQLSEPDPARALAPAVTDALALSAAERVLVTDPRATVLASTDPATNGGRAELGSSRVLEGRGWSGEIDVGGRHVLAAHAPVLDEEGELLGVAVAEADYPSIGERLSSAAADLALYLGLGAGLGTAGSLLLFRLVRRPTQGLRASEIATLADHREALLVSIREGVIAVGTDGVVTTVNDSARELLGLPRKAVGRPVTELGLEDHVEQLLLATDEAHDAVLVVGGQVLVFNQRVAASGGRGIGTVTTMRDRTDLVRMQDQLSSNLSLTDTLRAQTHEFANTLHTISGLLQLGEHDEVVAMVGELSRRQQEQAAHVAELVDDRPLAALVLAKASVAEEAGVSLELTADSRVRALPPDVSSDLVTVVGNLVDNAVDACRGRTDGEVRLRLNGSVGSVGSVTVEVIDNGPGIPDEVRDSLFLRGVSTKEPTPGGRGVGLALVGLVCLQRQGSVTADRVDGTTVFRVDLPVAAAAVTGG